MLSTLFANAAITVTLICFLIKARTGWCVSPLIYEVIHRSATVKADPGCGCSTPPGVGLIGSHPG
jgi:hypothetical protein